MKRRIIFSFFLTVYFAFGAAHGLSAQKLQNLPVTAEERENPSFFFQQSTAKNQDQLTDLYDLWLTLDFQLENNQVNEETIQKFLSAIQTVFTKEDLQFSEKVAPQYAIAASNLQNAVLKHDRQEISSCFAIYLYHRNSLTDRTSGTMVFIIISISILSLFVIVLAISFARSQSFLKHSQLVILSAMEGQEKERKRFSHELHDTVAQDLKVIEMQTKQILQFEEVKQNENAKNLINEILQLQKNSILQVRNICYNLTPPDLKNGDIRSAIEHFANTFAEQTGIECNYLVTDEATEIIRSWQQTHSLHIFRIVQEALNNASKHAKPSECSVTLRYDSISNKLILLICDDGQGFDYKKERSAISLKNSQKEHFGVTNMEERAKSLNASFDIKSDSEIGTEIKVTIPGVQN